MNRFLKILILGIVVIVLFIPMIQQQFNILPDDTQLDGAFTPATDTVLDEETWFSRRYQDKAENYLNENFGYRNFLVKMNNQIDFSFYKDINVKDVFLGENDYLFCSSFFHSYSGRSYKGDAHSDSVFTKLLEVNDWLETRHKKLLVCFTPCKESFYPEFLPDSCLPYISKHNAYTYYQQKLLSSKIPFLDYNTYFLNIKEKSPYPLFIQGALHWTTYGAHLALDTLLKRVAAETKKNINSIDFTNIIESDSAMSGDDDISKAMNLLKNVNSQKLGYPQIKVRHNQDSCYRPKVFIIGDSFFYGLNNTWVPMSFFSRESYFLYYYRQAIPYDTQKGDANVADMDLKKELENTDIVILFFNIGNLSKFPYDATKIIDKL